MNLDDILFGMFAGIALAMMMMTLANRSSDDDDDAEG